MLRRANSWFDAALIPVLPKRPCKLDRAERNLGQVSWSTGKLEREFGIDEIRPASSKAPLADVQVLPRKFGGLGEVPEGECLHEGKP